MLPKYPIYVPSRGRHDCCLTAKFLLRDGVPFHLVVEPQETDAYQKEFGKDRVLTLPFSNVGSVMYARNWIREHARTTDHARHWQLDDNIKRILERIGCWEKTQREAGQVLSEVEKFVDGYENIAIAGLRHTAFKGPPQPYSINKQVYSCVLVDHRLPFSWRCRRAEDTDYSLQVLSAGYCTVLFNKYCIEKAISMTMKGGNTETTYVGDGRAMLVRELQRRWPGLDIKMVRKYGQTRVNSGSIWRKFDTKLKTKETQK